MPGAPEPVRQPTRLKLTRRDLLTFSAPNDPRAELPQGGATTPPGFRRPDLWDDRQWPESVPQLDGIAPARRLPRPDSGRRPRAGAASGAGAAADPGGRIGAEREAAEIVGYRRDCDEGEFENEDDLITKIATMPLDEPMG
jgi:hypothetical protein